MRGLNQEVVVNVLSCIREDLVELMSELDRLEQRYTKAGAKRLRKKMMLFCKNRIHYAKALVEAEKGKIYLFVKETETKVQ